MTGAKNCTLIAASPRLASLQEYILISQDTQQVEIYRRQSDISWLYITYEPGDTVKFASVGVTLAIAELYTGTDMAQTA